MTAGSDCPENPIMKAADAAVEVGPKVDIMADKHDPFTAPRPKDAAPYHLADTVDRTDESETAHRAKLERAEALHRAANAADPTQRPWAKGQNPFYLEEEKDGNTK